MIVGCILGTYGPAAVAASCAEILEFQLTHDQLIEVSGLGQMGALVHLEARRTAGIDLAADLASTLQTSSAEDQSDLRTRYDETKLAVMDLNRRVHLALLSALDEYAQSTGDTGFEKIESGIEGREAILAKVRAARFAVREALDGVEALSNPWRPRGAEVPVRETLAALPGQLIQAGALLEEVFNLGMSFDLKVTRQAEIMKILSNVFERDDADWREHIGSVDPHPAELRFLVARLRDTERLLQDLHDELDVQLATLRGRVTETLMRLEDTFHNARRTK